MKRIISLLLAVLMTAVLAPFAVRGEAQRSSAVYSGSEKDARTLGVGDTFTLTYSISDTEQFADAVFNVRYPAEYVKPISYTPKMFGSKAFGDDDDFDYNNYVECQLLTTDGAGMPCSRVTAHADYFNNIFDDPGYSHNILTITYRIMALPVNEPDRNGAEWLTFDIEVLTSTYYNGSSWDEEDMTGWHIVYGTDPHLPVSTVPGKVYLNTVEPEAVYYGSSANVVSLGVGDTFTLAYSISDTENFADAVFNVRYPAEYVTPISYVAKMFPVCRFGEDDEFDYDNYIECVLSTTDGAGMPCSRVTAHAEYFDNVFDDPGYNNNIITITYRIIGLPQEGSPVNEDNVLTFDIEVLTSTHYNGSSWDEEDMTGWHTVYGTDPHSPVCTVPGRAYIGYAEPDAVYYGDSVDASALAVGDTFTLTYSLSNTEDFADAVFNVRYPAEYVTPVGYSELMFNNGRFGEEDENQYTDYIECVLSASDGEGMPCSRVTAHAIYCNLFFDPVELNDAIVSITYRIIDLPQEGSAVNGDNVLTFDIEVLTSTYYTGEWIENIDPDGTGHIEYDTAPHASVGTVPGRAYIGYMPVFHTVEFYDHEGNLITSVSVADSGEAQAPEVEQSYTENGKTYYFCGWDADITCVTGDIAVHPIYSEVGDIDSDGVLSFADVGMLSIMLSGGEFTDVMLLLGDYNGDGDVTYSDIAALYLMLLG